MATELSKKLDEMLKATNKWFSVPVQDLTFAELEKKAHYKLDQVAKGTTYARYASTMSGGQIKRGPHVCVSVPVKSHPERLSLEEMDSIRNIINECVCEVSQGVTYHPNPIHRGDDDFWQITIDKFGD